MNSFKVLGLAFVCVILARVPPDMPVFDLVCDLAAVGFSVLSIILAIREEARNRVSSTEHEAPASAPAAAVVSGRRVGGVSTIEGGCSNEVLPSPLPTNDTSDRRRRGACGVVGCPNLRPHSHVADLARRLRGQ